MPVRPKRARSDLHNDGLRNTATGYERESRPPRGRVRKVAARIVTFVVFTVTAAWAILVFGWEEFRKSWRPVQAR